MNASVSTLTTKGAKHGTCWMSHTSAKGWDMNSVVEPSVKNSLIEHLHFWVGDHT